MGPSSDDDDDEESSAWASAPSAFATRSLKWELSDEEDKLTAEGAELSEKSACMLLPEALFCNDARYRAKRGDNAGSPSVADAFANEAELTLPSWLFAASAVLLFLEDRIALYSMGRPQGRSLGYEGVPLA